MKSFREALLSLFAIGIVLYLYFLAGGVALYLSAVSSCTGTDQRPRIISQSEPMRVCQIKHMQPENYHLVSRLNRDLKSYRNTAIACNLPAKSNTASVSAFRRPLR